MSQGVYDPGGGLHQSGSFVYRQLAVFCSSWVSFSDLFFLKGGVRIIEGGSCQKEQVNSLSGGEQHGGTGGWSGEA